jgi:hypothetical protein
MAGRKGPAVHLDDFRVDDVPAFPEDDRLESVVVKLLKFHRATWPLERRARRQKKTAGKVPWHPIVLAVADANPMMVAKNIWYQKIPYGPEETIVHRMSGYGPECHQIYGSKRSGKPRRCAEDSGVHLHYQGPRGLTPVDYETVMDFISKFSPRRRRQ